MKVIIERDASNKFFVSTEESIEETNEAQPPAPGVEAAEGQNRVQARDINEALTLAGKLLSKPEAEDSPFNQGVQKGMGIPAQ